MKVDASLGGNMIDDARQSGPWFRKRWLTVLLWLWLGLVGFFAMLAGLVADGCTDSSCDFGVAKAWLVLLAGQAGILVGAIVLRRRLGPNAGLVALVGLAVVSPLTVVTFASYVNRFF